MGLKVLGRSPYKSWSVDDSCQLRVSKLQFLGISGIRHLAGLRSIPFWGLGFNSFGLTYSEVLHAILGFLASGFKLCRVRL